MTLQLDWERDFHEELQPPLFFRHYFLLLYWIQLLIMALCICKSFQNGKFQKLDSYSLVDLNITLLSFHLSEILP